MPSSPVCMFCRYRATPRYRTAAAPVCHHGQGSNASQGPALSQDLLFPPELAEPPTLSLVQATPQAHE